MTDDEMLIVGYYALRRSKSHAEFCAMRESPPSFERALRYVRVHMDEAPEWVRNLVAKLERT